jgi:hypothetical protein
MSKRLGLGIASGMIPIDREVHTDPAQMTRAELDELVRRDGVAVVADGVRSAMRNRLEVPAFPWPETLRQEDAVSCQTVGLINGIRVSQAAFTSSSQVWEPRAADIALIRERAAADTEQRGEAQTAYAVAQLLHTGRVLSRYVQISNPIHAAAEIAEGGFALVTSAEQWHAYTIVPNFPQRPGSDGEPADFLRLDSLDGSEQPMDATAFAELILGQDPTRGDETLVCRL